MDAFFLLLSAFFFYIFFIKPYLDVKAENEAAKERYRSIENKLADSELSQKNKEIFENPTHTRFTHCYSCHTNLSSKKNETCTECQWLICSSCGSCEYECNNGKYQLKKNLYVDLNNQKVINETQHNTLFKGRVVGVSFKNEDGTSRQNIIRKLNSASRIWLVHDCNNIHDKNAIKVVSKYGDVGYLPKGETHKFDYSKLKSVKLTILTIGRSKNFDYLGIIVEAFINKKQQEVISSSSINTWTKYNYLKSLRFSSESNNIDLNAVYFELINTYKAIAYRNSTAMLGRVYDTVEQLDLVEIALRDLFKVKYERYQNEGIWSQEITEHCKIIIEQQIIKNRNLFNKPKNNNSEYDDYYDDHPARYTDYENDGYVADRGHCEDMDWEDNNY